MGLLKDKNMNEIIYNGIIKDIYSRYKIMGHDNFGLYGPLSSEYWNRKVKILICNLETYNQTGCFVIDYSKFKEWYKAPTCFFSAKINYILQKRLEGEIVNRQNLNSYIYDASNIDAYLKYLAYLNFRVDTNHEVKQNTSQIITSIREHKEEIKTQIMNMNPTIILVGGKIAKDCYNIIFDSDLRFLSNIKTDAITVFSVPHFSRISYDYWLQKINEIANEIE